MNLKNLGFVLVIAGIIYQCSDHKVSNPEPPARAAKVAQSVCDPLPSNPADGQCAGRWSETEGTCVDVQWDASTSQWLDGCDPNIGSPSSPCPLPDNPSDRQTARTEVSPGTCVSAYWDAATGKWIIGSPPAILNCTPSPDSITDPDDGAKAKIEIDGQCETVSWDADDGRWYIYDSAIPTTPVCTPSPDSITNPTDGQKAKTEANGECITLSWDADDGKWYVYDPSMPTPPTPRVCTPSPDSIANPTDGQTAKVEAHGDCLWVKWHADVQRWYIFDPNYPTNDDVTCSPLASDVANPTHRQRAEIKILVSQSGGSPTAQPARCEDVWWDARYGDWSTVLPPALPTCTPSTDSITNPMHGDRAQLLVLDRGCINVYWDVGAGKWQPGTTPTCNTYSSADSLRAGDIEYRMVYNDPFEQSRCGLFVYDGTQWNEKKNGPCAGKSYPGVDKAWVWVEDDQGRDSCVLYTWNATDGKWMAPPVVGGE